MTKRFQTSLRFLPLMPPRGGGAGLPDDFVAARALQRARRALVDALRRAPVGPLARADLETASITPEMAREAKALESSRFVEPAIVPGQPAEDRADHADAVAGTNQEVRLLAGLWTEIAEFLCSMRTGNPVEMRASIRARWHEARRVCQVLGGAQTSNALGANGQGGGDRSLAELARYVALRAALVFPAKVGVVLQKELVPRLEAHDLGRNVEVRHFGALAGLDHWRDFGGVILIGRTAPPPGSMEASAAVLTGQPTALPSEPSFASGGILLRDGSTEAVRMIRLVDPIAEALRWQICEGNLIQALGRIRPLRAHGRAGFFVDVLCDVPLPIVVDEVERWNEARPEAWAAMAADGVIYTSVADMMVARPDLAPTEDKARWLLEERPRSGVTSKDTFFLDVTPDHALLSKRVHVKRRGHEPTGLFLLPNGPVSRGELRRRLVGIFGRLDEFKVEGEVDARERAGAACAAQIAAIATTGHQFGAVLASAERLRVIGFEVSVIAAVFERGGATQSELLRGMKPRPSADELDRALSRLSADGAIIPTIEQGSGRPSTRYTVAPEEDE